MRIGIVIPVGGAAGLDGESVVAAALHAESAGLDLVWLEGDPTPAVAPAAALAAAAFVAARTNVVRLAACAPIGPHPVLIAEQAAVADNASNGRLLLVLNDGQSDAELLEETAEVVLAATGPRPFSHRGRRWTIPAGLAGNASERRITVTPKPAQLELPVWLVGRSAVQVGQKLGLSHVACPADSATIAAEAWSATELALGRRASRLRRPAIRQLGCTSTGDFDDDAVTAALAAEADCWGVDVVLMRLPVRLGRAAWRRAIRRLASFVRPRLQMDHVPDHLADYWRRELPRLTWGSERTG
jgi:alkanesulfonate monooxygenase SsuD/methylene tetrahydromethanopterin reductase-like flavin-dependent oxidoreductase (luciferase family)